MHEKYVTNAAEAVDATGKISSDGRRRLASMAVLVNLCNFPATGSSAFAIKWRATTWILIIRILPMPYEVNKHT